MRVTFTDFDNEYYIAPYSVEIPDEAHLHCRYEVLFIDGDEPRELAHWVDEEDCWQVWRDGDTTAVGYYSDWSIER